MCATMAAELMPHRAWLEVRRSDATQFGGNASRDEPVLRELAMVFFAERVVGIVRRRARGQGRSELAGCLEARRMGAHSQLASLPTSVGAGCRVDV
jgi:hypothetical protein